MNKTNISTIKEAIDKVIKEGYNPNYVILFSLLKEIQEQIDKEIAVNKEFEEIRKLPKGEGIAMLAEVF